ncbi:MAG TPA: hypothetical protein VN677_09285 [Gemmatimonadaceae bacterium]|jgi:hypothetical protein|nr:hypothetical protein [Gemmatimonadaceae bacterium]
MQLDEMLYALLFFTFSMTALVLGVRMIIRFMELKRRPAPDTTALDERMARIEQIVEATAIEVERISEGQRFTTKLLSERQPVAMPHAAIRAPEQIITPH